MNYILSFFVALMVDQQFVGPARASQATHKLNKVNDTATAPAGPIDFVMSLRSKYMNSIVYTSDKAAATVKGFNIDCKQRDGRYISLENLLLVGISQLQSDTSREMDFVQEAGGEVRISQALVDSKGRLVTRPDVAFEVNKWGELIPVGVPAGAVSAACAGVFGPIWSLPISGPGNRQTKVEHESEAKRYPQPHATDHPGSMAWSAGPAKEWTHQKQCEFFKLAAFSMTNFRDQGRPQSYGLNMVAFQLANYHTVSDQKIDVESGIEAETKLNIADDVARMAHDIWTVRNTRGEPIPPSLVVDFASNSCGWPAFDW